MTDVCSSLVTKIVYSQETTFARANFRSLGEYCKGGRVARKATRPPLQYSPDNFYGLSHRFYHDRSCLQQVFQ